MLAFSFPLFFAFQFLSVFAAAPAPYFKARDVTALSNTDIPDLSPLTQFSRASYCPLRGWKWGSKPTLPIFSNMPLTFPTLDRNLQFPLRV
ncbi:hypothetical protein K443DRAFT_673403 [Laccaria amethystina LaAM-08-1]|uniref:Secreted protein n=1 Tax=Laccaria amethystina LaAM-08-1 TaxID=1095629 RepID=A0A0C9Y0U4_9AGAR|nr:hypothetical protein K443DRAFT_673403 [Laccaria amethystina LaAM-08-1]